MWTRLTEFLSDLIHFRTRRRLDDEVRHELEAHVDLLTDRYIRSGLAPADARMAARRQFGNVTLVREELRGTAGRSWVQGVIQDVRYGWRQVARSRGFSSVVVATLALGIGGTTAVFSVVEAVLLAPLLYEQPDRLVRFYQQEPDKPATRHFLTGTHFTALRDQATSFEAMAALNTYSETGRDLVKDGQAERLRVLRITSDYFQTLRASGLRGPGFERADEVGARRVVLSHGLWRRRFASDPSIIGSSIRLSGEPHEVVGIAPESFEDLIAGDVDAWIPYNLVGDTNEENTSLSAVGRLRAGVTLEQAQAELSVLSRSMKARWPAARLSAVVALPLQDDLVATARAPVFLLLGAVGLVLLIACVNVANLVLVRATGRVHEFAIRSALGSGRGRLVRQLFIESLLLAGLGGGLGLALAAFGLTTLQELGRDALPRIDDVGFDPLVLGFSALVTVMTAVGFGVMPALRFARVTSTHALRQQSRSTTGTRGQARLRAGLAAAQLALALTLLVGAGVLLTSFHHLRHVDLGFRTEAVFTFNVSLPTMRYNAARRATFQEALASAIRAIPGVTAAGGISFLPATGSYHGWNTSILTGPLAGSSLSRAHELNVQQRTVSGDVFAALGIRLLAGRTFDTRDNVPAESRAVVSANFARAAFPGMPLDRVIGQRISTVGETLSIIGVVGDVALDVYGAPTLAVYHAHAQFAENRNWMLTQVVSTKLAPDDALAAVRATIATMDPELVVYRAAPMSEVVGRSTSRERFALVLMATFASVALLLAGLGLYGVLAYSVRQRTTEIGIRMALGATGADVRTLVLRQAVGVLGVGLLVGVAGALVFGRWLTALVFEINPWDPRILLATAALLTMTGFLAAWLPARRASRIAPRIAMQHDR